MRERITVWLQVTDRSGGGAAPRWVGAVATAALGLNAAAALGQSFSGTRLVATVVLVGVSVAGLWRVSCRRVVGGVFAMLAAVALVGSNSASVALLGVFVLAFEAGYLNAG